MKNRISASVTKETVGKINKLLKKKIENLHEKTGDNKFKKALARYFD